MVSALAAAGYSKDLGPGVYDVHSPQVRTLMNSNMPAQTRLLLHHDVYVLR
jgi:methionine synthase II (cobalamin-independent)